MGKEEDYKKLMDDSEFKKGERVCKRLEQAGNNVLSARKMTLKTLRSLKKEVETSYDMSRKSIIGGTTGTVIGSALAITGFGLSFVTFGASLGLTIAGTIISAAGGITAAGANIGYSAVSSHSLKHAKEAVENDQKVLEEFKKLNDELARIIDSLAEKHPSIKKDEIHKMLFDCACLGKTCAMAIWCGYKMIDGFFDVGRNIATITGQSASAAARTTIWAGMNTAKQVVNVAGAALDVVTIPIDLFVMIKASIDVHKFRTTGESNSNVARKIGGFITQLEEHRDELKRQCGIE